MRSILSLIFLVSFSASASEVKTRCEVKQNTIIKFVNEFALADHNRPLPFGSIDDYHFLLANLGDNQAELQIYDRLAPSRIFSKGALSQEQALELTIWSRDVLIQVNCQIL